jgi:hypothetical protein
MHNGRGLGRCLGFDHVKHNLTNQLTEQSVPMISNRKLLVDPKHRLCTFNVLDVAMNMNRIA